MALRSSEPQSIGSLDHGPSLPLIEGGPRRTVVRQKECRDGILEQATWPAPASGGKGWCLSCRWMDSITLSTTLVASPRIFFPKSTSDGAGFRKGGGDLPGLGFPPPSRSGRTLKPRRTITVGSNKACNLETGVVDGRSTTSGAGTPPVRLWALTSKGGSDPSMAICCIMAVLGPCIISGG